MGMKNFLNQALDWLYTPVCAGCGKMGDLLCGNCRAALAPTGSRCCPKCGKPLPESGRCSNCERFEFQFRAARAPYLYQAPLDRVVKRLKYGRNFVFAPLLGELLFDFYPSLGWKENLVIPVPLAPRRLRQRRFNQSELIAKEFSSLAGLPMVTTALLRIRETPRQVGLNAEERQENLSGAFAAEPCLVRGKRVLLIDDVMTTGATFSECARELLQAGACSVDCLSAATTPLDHGQ